MEPAEYERMYRAESRHWWYLGMQNLTQALWRRFLPPVAGLKILEAGCGTGSGMQTYLTQSARVVGFDLSPHALKFCQLRAGLSVAQASVAEIPFKTNHFDLVTSFDVLYERAVASDAAAVSEFFRVLRPGGYLLLRLPAYDWLRGQHDLTIHTARRYTAPQLVQLITASGFRCLHVTYANTFLFPLALAKRLLERIWPAAPDSSDLSVQVGPFNRLFQRILSSEAFLAARSGLPFGLSVIVLGQKPQTHG